MKVEQYEYKLARKSPVGRTKLTLVGNEIDSSADSCANSYFMREILELSFLIIMFSFNAIRFSSVANEDIKERPGGTFAQRGS